MTALCRLVELGRARDVARTTAITANARLQKAVAELVSACLEAAERRYTDKLNQMSQDSAPTTQELLDLEVARHEVDRTLLLSICHDELTALGVRLGLHGLTKEVERSRVVSSQREEEAAVAEERVRCAWVRFRTATATATTTVSTPSTPSPSALV